MAVNKQNVVMLQMNPDAPEFYPGIPYRNYWMDLNFENYVYKCASTSSPLYSYVNARGLWLKGFYLPISNIWDDDELPEAPEGCRRLFCLYVITFSDQVETDSMSMKSPEVASAVLDIGIKLHETQDFYQSVTDVAAQIREFCGAERCALYTVDKDTQECSFIDSTGIRNQFMEESILRKARISPIINGIWQSVLQVHDRISLHYFF